ncbi:hypothetical protein CRENBAI_011436 [Crenichthys baileyi]|uniref:Ig-like domain-containing protein n=1 Tax=Crenichthys baileyi TaxID=28760 RepID=A0AAV9SLV6_9TELE
MRHHSEALEEVVLLVKPIPEREENKMSSNSHISSQRSSKQTSRGGRFHLSKLIEELPVYVSIVKKFVVTEGKHGKCCCFVIGKPKPEIIWKKDGAPLEPDRACCAVQTADVAVKERDVAVLEFEVPDEMIPAAWYLENQRLMPSSKYGMEQKGTRRRLTIHDVGTDDNGVYLCEMPERAKSTAELAVKGRMQPASLMDGWMDVDGWIDGWLVGWMGGWMDGWISLLA